MKLDDVVPWGRSLAEYRALFDLSPTDLEGRILGCGDGPASFNAEMTMLGRRVISLDPIYLFSGEEIARRVAESYDAIIGQVKLNPQRYVWSHFHDPDDLGRARLAVMQTFLEDYEKGRAALRYRPESLPHLSFEDGDFDLALSSHLLFLYSEQLDLNFHLASIRELLRVAYEVRIFPLLALDCALSPHVEPVRLQLAEAGFTVELCAVPYEFQRGGNQMMKIGRRNPA
jgi:hypothetical protein